LSSIGKYHYFVFLHLIIIFDEIANNFINKTMSEEWDLDKIDDYMYIVLKNITLTRIMLKSEQKKHLEDGNLK
jgi:hypothetical protein